MSFRRFEGRDEDDAASSLSSFVSANCDVVVVAAASRAFFFSSSSWSLRAFLRRFSSFSFFCRASYSASSAELAHLDLGLVDMALLFVSLCVDSLGFGMIDRT